MATTSTARHRERDVPRVVRHERTPALTAEEQLAPGLERLLPAAVQALEDPARRGYEQFVRHLTDFLVALVRESVEAHGDALWRAERDGGARAGDERSLPTAARPVIPIGRSSGEGEPGLKVLGRDRALLRVDGAEVVLSQRHSEIVVLLAARPTGMTGEQLALALYGERGKPQTARAEVSRLRRLLGGRIQTDPYRLQAVMRSDIADVERLLRDGRVADAAALYRGPLLPRSDAPGVIDLRDELDGWTRRAALDADDGDALWTWVNTPSGQDDIQAWKRLLTNIPHHDGRRALAAARLERLRPLFAAPSAGGSSPSEIPDRDQPRREADRLRL
jgi:hypothetical protein